MWSNNEGIWLPKGNWFDWSTKTYLLWAKDGKKSKRTCLLTLDSRSRYSSSCTLFDLFSFGFWSFMLGLFSDLTSNNIYRSVSTMRINIPNMARVDTLDFGPGIPQFLWWKRVTNPTLPSRKSAIQWMKKTNQRTCKTRWQMKLNIVNVETRS